MTLLEKTKQKIEESVPEKAKKMFTTIVANGMKLMWSKETHQTMREYIRESVQSPETIPDAVAAGIRGIIRMLLQASKTKPDPNEIFYGASYPAALVLMCDALEFVEVSKKIPITNDIIAETTKAVVAQLNALYGIKKETLDAAMQHAQKTQQERDAAQTGGPGAETPAMPPTQPMEAEV